MVIGFKFYIGTNAYRHFRIFSGDQVGPEAAYAYHSR